MNKNYTQAGNCPKKIKLRDLSPSICSGSVIRKDFTPESKKCQFGKIVSQNPANWQPKISRATMN